MRVILPGLVTTVAVCVLSMHSYGACVWRVSDDTGKVLYLGGSIHALTSTDYPLPAAYNRAFDASAHLVLEANPKEFRDLPKNVLKAGEYPKGDNLKNHVDPRTYDYLRRFFGLIKVPEEKFSRYRPWLLAEMLEAPQLHGLSLDLGVEGFLIRRAQVNSKPISGLETLKEGMEIMSGLTDRQSETVLLLTFIPTEHGKEQFATMKEAWRRGDTETLWRIGHQQFRDFPSMEEREINARNHNWIPKIEKYLHSGQIYFVVVGAGHMGGPDGVLALLRQRSYRIEQL